MTENLPRIRIDVVSDVICPWCFIGKRDLEAALKQRPSLQVDVHWRAFQLNPDMPAEGMDRADYLRAKFGDAAGGDIYDRVKEAGRQAGIDFVFDAIKRTPNTVGAHRLIALADGTDRQDAVVEALFRAYFLNGQDIGSIETLTAVAEAAGLTAETAERLATTEDLKAEVLAEDSIARQTGVNGVPCFIFDRAFAVSGAQPPEVLVSALDHAVNAHTAAAE